MNLSVLHPLPSYQMSKPIKVTARGNLYKINILKNTPNATETKPIELWTTKEAVQKHFENITGNPHDYELKKFARVTYEKQLRTHNGVLPHQGLLVTSDTVSHGNPKLWPHTLSHPEIKL